MRITYTKSPESMATADIPVWLHIITDGRDTLPKAAARGIACFFLPACPQHAVLPASQADILQWIGTTDGAGRRLFLMCSALARPPITRLIHERL